MTGAQFETREALLEAIAAGSQPTAPGYLTVAGAQVVVEVRGLRARDRDLHDMGVINRARNEDIDPDRRLWLSRVDLLARTVYFGDVALFDGEDGEAALANVEPAEARALFDVATELCGLDADIAAQAGADADAEGEESDEEK